MDNSCLHPLGDEAGVGLFQPTLEDSKIVSPRKLCAVNEHKGNTRI